MIGTIFYLLGSINFFLDSTFTKKMSNKLIILIFATLLMISYQDLYKNNWKPSPRLWKRFGYFSGLFLILAATVLAYTRLMSLFKLNIRYW